MTVGFRACLVSALLLCAALPVSAAEPDWKSLGVAQSDGTESFVDMASIHPEGSLLTVWSREQFAKPLSRGLFRASAYDRLTLNSIDCAHNSLVATQVILRNRNGDTLDDVANPQALLQSGNASPPSTAGVVAQAVCQYVGSATPQPDNYDANDPPSDSFIKYAWQFINTDNTGVTSYVARDDIKAGSPQYASWIALLARFDYPHPTDVYGGLASVSVIRWLFNCQDKSAIQGNTANYEQGGKFISRNYIAKLVPFKVKDGTTGATLLVRACAVASAEAQAQQKETSRYSAGTAWLSDSGYLVTTYHVIANVKQIFVYQSDKTPIEAKVVTADPANDLAVLSADLNLKHVKGLALAKGNINLGAEVFTLGFPHVNLLGLKPKFTLGEVSSTAGLRDDPRFLQISTQVQSGNSGGPLVNSAGEVVGIIEAKLNAVDVAKTTGDMPQNVNYAIKARYLQGLLDDLPARDTTPARIKPGSIEDMVGQMDAAVFLLLAPLK